MKIIRKRQPPKERETEAAHVIRNGKITVTVLLEPLDDGRWRVRRENNPAGIVVRTRSVAKALGDSYLEGFSHGYEEGWAEYERSDAHQRAVERDERRRRGIPPCSCLN